MRNLVHLKLDFYELDDFSIKSLLERNLRISLEENERFVAINQENETIIQNFDRKFEEKQIEITQIEQIKNEEIKVITSQLTEEINKSKVLILSIEEERRFKVDLERNNSDLLKQIRTLEISNKQFEDKYEKTQALFIKADKELEVARVNEKQALEAAKAIKPRLSEFELKTSKLQEDNFRLDKEKIGLENQISNLKLEIKSYQKSNENSQAQIESLAAQLVKLRED